MTTDTTTTTAIRRPRWLLERAKAFHDEISGTAELLRNTADAAARREIPVASLCTLANLLDEHAAAYYHAVAGELADLLRTAGQPAEQAAATPIAAAPVDEQLDRAQAAFEHWIGHVNGAALLVRATGHQAASSQIEPPALLTIADVLEEAADQLVAAVGWPLKCAAGRAP